MNRARHGRGATLVEMTLVVTLMLLLVAAFGVPGYRSYADSRANKDAATVLASDLALLVRSAQNASDDEGASLLIDSMTPLRYRGYLGRSENIDPSARLGRLLFERTFSGVTLDGGPIDPSTPLLFASNGSAQYETGGTIASQHAEIGFVLRGGSGKPATVTLDLYTGAAHTGN